MNANRPIRLLGKLVTVKLREMNTTVEYGEYRFTALADKRRGGGTSKLFNYYQLQSPLLFSEEESGKTTAQFRGALLKLFGPPLGTTKLADEAFYYVIEAMDSSGQACILTAYEGPSGSAIGAKVFRHDESRSAAESLIHLIRATAPADFEAMTYDEDTGSTTIYGCKGGQGYYREFRTGEPNTKG